MKLISGNAKVVRNINRAVILNIIRTKQPISRVKIAKLTGLNKSTVSSIVSDLLLEEIISEQVKADQNVGRNPLDIYLRSGKYLVGAINIDAALTRFAIVDVDGTVLITSEIDTKPQNPTEFVEYCMDQLFILCEQKKINSLYGLGVSIAGIVDPNKLVVKFAPNLGWENFDIGSVIKRKWPDVNLLAIGNDAKSSALAELWFGTQGVPLSDFVFLSVGPGLGAGIVVDRKILEGETHASGEFGHMIIFEGGEMCVCGNHGCWETYASDRATVKRYIARKQTSSQQSIDLVIEDIVELAKLGDSTAIEVLKQTGYYLGLGLVNIIKSIDPRAIIMGGKIIQAWDIIYPEIMNVVKLRAFFGNKEKSTLILPTTLKIRPRLLGAATLAIKEIFEDYKIVT